MKKTLYLTLSLCMAVIWTSCEKHEQIFDHPFIYVTDNDKGNSSSAQIDSRGNFEASYAIVLSSKTLSEDLIVEYELQVGDGLTEGVDFELLSPRAMVFPVGLYQNVIHIRWKPRVVDESKDNSVRIAILSNSLGFTIGYPGPDKLNSYYTVTKINVQ